MLAALLCTAWVLMAGTGSAFASGPQPTARPVPATDSACCYLLTISVYETAQGDYPRSSRTNPSPTGWYRFVMDGEGEGLAKLEPADGARQIVYSSLAGVAEGFVGEDNQVTLSGQPYGCPATHPRGPNTAFAFGPTGAGELAPWYQPPPSLTDPVANMDFGRPLDNLGPACIEFGTVEQATYDALTARYPNARLLENFAGGPIYAYSGLTVAGLLKGGHELDIECYQQASGTNSSGYSFDSKLAIVIEIVHYSPDDENNLIHRLRSLMGTRVSASDDAAFQRYKYDGKPGHTHPNGCAGTTS